MFGCDGRVVYIAVKFNIALYRTSAMLKFTSRRCTQLLDLSFSRFRQQLKHFYCVNIEIGTSASTTLAHYRQLLMCSTNT